MADGCTPSIWEVERIGGSGLHSHSLRYREFKASLGYAIDCFKQNKIRTGDVFAGFKGPGFWHCMCGQLFGLRLALDSHDQVEGKPPVL